MNPFSQFLSQHVTNRKFRVFVHKWDVIEQLVVATFREQGDLNLDARTWTKFRNALRSEYPKWLEQLEPFWRKATIDGKPVEIDPFIWLLEYKNLSEFRQNWRAMQTLPAAREAINRLLLELQTDKQ